MTKKTLLQKIFGTAEERREHSLKNVIKSTFAGVTTAGVADCVVRGVVLNANAALSVTEQLAQSGEMTVEQYPCSGDIAADPWGALNSDNPAVAMFAFDYLNGDAV